VRQVRLTKLYVRFFRSFNFDYERKAHREAEPKDWEMVGDSWFPFVRIDFDEAVTAVVGANESGKSHLIEAIKRAQTGERIDRRDFCRYSSLFSVETDRMRVPDFGLEAQLQTDEDVASISSISGQGEVGSLITLLRMGGQENLLIDSSGTSHALSQDELSDLEGRLPHPYELATNVPLPDSIAFDSILGRDSGPLARRRRRFELTELLESLPEKTPEAITSSAAQIAALLDEDGSADTENPSPITPAQLGRSLLLDVARIDRSAVEDLEAALRDGQEGRVGGLIEQMNRSLAAHLNFNRWWRQDQEFQLRVAPRERELVFTIRDRTGTDYSFRERSRGLTYFLSYFVQLRAHRQTSDRPEVLLMDEPDAYLSSVGQQDLLRALEHFARPDDGSRRDQVVYVTHSPFLINKNAAHRLRVLDKGSNEEGTRIVRDVARNHYEPLRSSVGSYVAETVFIGGANLLVEGVADQVLLAGVTSLLRYRGEAPRRLLDLNDVTIVPAGSASSVPYMAYLARGRDEVKPACIAMLDGDQAGREAARKLARSSDGSRKPILQAEYIVNVADWAGEANLNVLDEVRVREVEDLIPLAIAVEASRSYAIRLLQASSEEAERITVQRIGKHLKDDDGSVWRAIESAFAEVLDGAHIDKIGFAKEVVTFIETVRSQPRRPPGLPDLEHNFGELIAELAERLREASRDEAERRTNRRTDRIVRSFLRDYPDVAPRNAADQVVRELEASLEDTAGDEAVRLELAALRREFKLSTDPLTPVPEYSEFRRGLTDLGTKRRLAYRESAGSDASGAVSPGATD
jgi:predicted ATPase